MNPPQVSDTAAPASEAPFASGSSPVIPRNNPGPSAHLDSLHLSPRAAKRRRADYTDVPPAQAPGSPPTTGTFPSGRSILTLQIPDDDSDDPEDIDFHGPGVHQEGLLSSSADSAADSESDSSSDDSDLLIDNSEIVELMTRKTTVQRHSKGKKGTRPPKRAAKTLAQDIIKEQTTGRRSRKRKHAPSANKENEAPIPAPMPGRALDVPTYAGGVPPSNATKPKKNFIYEFYLEVEVNPARLPHAVGDKHYQCRHVKVGEHAKIISITKKANGSTNGLVAYLERAWPELYAIYSGVKERKPAAIPTPLEIHVARGERSVQDTAVQEHLQNLLKTAEQMNALLDQGPFNQDEFERLIAEWTALSNQPFEEIESPSLRRVLQYVHGQTPLRIPSADTLKRRILELGQGALEETKKLVQRIKGMISLSLDAWTSSNGYAFLAIVMHYVDDNWELQELLIDFRELIGEHSGENFAGLVWDTLELYGLVGRVMAVNCDNATNNDTMMDALERRCIALGIPFSARVARMRCMPHTIHLAALQLLETIGAIPKQSTDMQCEYQEAVVTPLSSAADELAAVFDEPAMFTDGTPASTEENAAGSTQPIRRAHTAPDIGPGPDMILRYDSVHVAIEKLRRIVRSVRSSPQRRQTWMQYASIPASSSRAEGRHVEETHSGADSEASQPASADTHEVTKMLILDVKTRWSSTHQMMQRALLYRDAIAMFVATAPKDAKLQPLTQADWDAIELVEEWLRLFREATTLMSTTSGITLSSVHSTFRELQDHVRDAFKDMPSTAPHSLKRGLLNAHTKLSDYYLIFDASPYYVWAALLDPWINLGGILHDCEQEDDPDVVECQIRHVNACKSQLEQHFKKYYLPCTGLEATNVASDPTTGVTSSPVQRRHFRGKTRYQRPSASTPAGPVDELKAYFRLDAPSVDCASDDPLKWWQSREKTFPHLARLARDVFSIPGCAVAVERIFSAGRDAISLRRSSLKPETIRSLMLLKQKLLCTRSRLQEALSKSHS